MKKTPQFLEFNFARLVADLSAIQKDVKEKMAKSASSILLMGYWQMGERLCQEPPIADYQKNESGFILTRLAESLSLEYSLLTRIIKFYKTWPKKELITPYSQLSWSHFKKLMAIKDDEERQFYLAEAKKNQWNKQELIYRVKSRYFESVKNQPVYARPTLLRRADKMYLYAGSVAKVVDGDTMVVCADLGFNVRIDVRLRLRGINASELTAEDKSGARSDSGSSLAQQAKQFLADQLEHAEIIIFQSFKVDLYGRYVADIFYLPGERNKEKILEHGRFLNQDLLDAGLAKII